MKYCEKSDCTAYTTKQPHNCNLVDSEGDDKCDMYIKYQKDPVAKLHCSVGLKALRPKGEPHPAMISIYAYADEIEDKDPERADAICEIALNLEIKLWHLDKGF